MASYPKSRRDRFHEGMSQAVEYYGAEDKQNKEDALRKLLQSSQQEFLGGQGDKDRATKLEIARLMAGRQNRATVGQKRLETKAITEAYQGQTRKLREQQQGLETATNLLEDPNNLNDQQVRRATAMAVNSGALSDQDVNDAVPGDIGQTARKAWNFVQPALSVFGAEKKPIYTDENRKQLQDLFKNRSGTIGGQLQDAGSQVRTLAPGLAPTLAEEDPEQLETFLTGLTTPASNVGKRINQPPAETEEQRYLRLKQKHGK
jgi:hypothetical protein